MIAVTRIRDLDLAPTPGQGGLSHMSAASGLVRVGGALYVVADDELALGMFPETGSEPGRLIRLFEGDLPEDKAERKRMKPDLEVLTLMPASPDLPHGALLALGSGSRPNRCRGALVAFGSDGHINGHPVELDISPLFASLHAEFAELNIEGAVVLGDELRLFQRGNTSAANAIIRYPLPAALEAMRRAGADAVQPLSIKRLSIDVIDGVPFCFTDAAALPDGNMAFCAVAEDTEDAYRDGPCIGAGVGLLDSGGNLISFDRLDHPHKIEGIDARREGGRLHMLLVTDPDDPQTPATLLSASIG